jgi:hypothetical protein
MAWMAQHLFVHTKDSDPAALAAALNALLIDPAHRADLEDFEDPPPPVLVYPPIADWIAVTGVAGWLDDLGWAARQLSETCGEQALSCEVFGNCYRLRLKHYLRGSEERVTQIPESGWCDQDDAPRGAKMPLYEDAEQLAYRELVALGIPAPLLLVGARPLGAPEEPLEPGRGVQLLPDGDQVKQSAIELALVPFEGDDAPLLPNRVSQDFGLMLFEDRYLEGEPSQTALDRLLAIEEAIIGRARRALPEGQVTLTVTYFAGPHQAKLDTMLQARDRHTLPSDQRMRPPWWQFWRHLGRMR